MEKVVNLFVDSCETKLALEEFSKSYKSFDENSYKLCLQHADIVFSKVFLTLGGTDEKLTRIAIELCAFLFSFRWESCDAHMFNESSCGPSIIKRIVCIFQENNITLKCTVLFLLANMQQTIFVQEYSLQIITIISSVLCTALENNSNSIVYSLKALSNLVEHDLWRDFGDSFPYLSVSEHIMGSHRLCIEAIQCMELCLERKCHSSTLILKNVTVLDVKNVMRFITTKLQSLNEYTFHQHQIETKEGESLFDVHVYARIWRCLLQLVPVNTLVDMLREGSKSLSDPGLLLQPFQHIYDLSEQEGLVGWKALLKRLCTLPCWMQTYPKVLKLILRFLWSILMAPGASAGGTSERSDISESRNNACFVDEKCAQIDVQKSYCVDMLLLLAESSWPNPQYLLEFDFSTSSKGNNKSNSSSQCTYENMVKIFLLDEKELNIEPLGDIGDPCSNLTSVSVSQIQSLKQHLVARVHRVECGIHVVSQFVWNIYLDEYKVLNWSDFAKHSLFAQKRKCPDTVHLPVDKISEHMTCIMALLLAGFESVAHLYQSYLQLVSYCRFHDFEARKSDVLKSITVDLLRRDLFVDRCMEQNDVTEMELDDQVDDNIVSDTTLTLIQHKLELLVYRLVETWQTIICVSGHILIHNQLKDIQSENINHEDGNRAAVVDSGNKRSLVNFLNKYNYKVSFATTTMNTPTKIARTIGDGSKAYDVGDTPIKLYQSYRTPDVSECSNPILSGHKSEIDEGDEEDLRYIGNHVILTLDSDGHPSDAVLTATNDHAHELIKHFFHYATKIWDVFWHKKGNNNIHLLLCREMFVESLFWILHRFSAFDLQIADADIISSLYNYLPFNHIKVNSIPKIMISVPLVLSLVHVEYCDNLLGIACGIGASNFDLALKSDYKCLYETGVILHYALFRCTHGIVESYAVPSLLKWLSCTSSSPLYSHHHVKSREDACCDDEDGEKIMFVSSQTGPFQLKPLSPHYTDRRSLEGYISNHEKTATVLGGLIATITQQLGSMSADLYSSNGSPISSQLKEQMLVGIKTLIFYPLLYMKYNHIHGIRYFFSSINLYRQYCLPQEIEEELKACKIFMKPFFNFSENILDWDEMYVTGFQIWKKLFVIWLSLSNNVKDILMALKTLYEDKNMNKIICPNRSWDPLIDDDWPHFDRSKEIKESKNILSFQHLHTTDFQLYNIDIKIASLLLYETYELVFSSIGNSTDESYARDMRQIQSFETFSVTSFISSILPWWSHVNHLLLQCSISSLELLSCPECNSSFLGTITSSFECDVSTICKLLHIKNIENIFLILKQQKRILAATQVTVLSTKEVQEHSKCYSAVVHDPNQVDVCNKNSTTKSIETSSDSVLLSNSAYGVAIAFTCDLIKKAILLQSKIFSRACNSYDVAKSRYEEIMFVSFQELNTNIREMVMLLLSIFSSLLNNPSSHINDNHKINTPLSASNMQIMNAIISEVIEFLLICYAFCSHSKHKNSIITSAIRQFWNELFSFQQKYSHFIKYSQNFPILISDIHGTVFGDNTSTSSRNTPKFRVLDSNQLISLETFFEYLETDQCDNINSEHRRPIDNVKRQDLVIASTPVSNINDPNKIVFQNTRSFASVIVSALKKKREQVYMQNNSLGNNSMLESKIGEMSNKKFIKIYNSPNIVRLLSESNSLLKDRISASQVELTSQVASHSSQDDIHLNEATKGESILPPSHDFNGNSNLTSEFREYNELSLGSEDAIKNVDSIFPHVSRANYEQWVSPVVIFPHNLRRIDNSSAIKSDSMGDCAVYTQPLKQHDNHIEVRNMDSMEVVRENSDTRQHHSGRRHSKNSRLDYDSSVVTDDGHKVELLLVGQDTGARDGSNACSPVNKKLKLSGEDIDENDVVIAPKKFIDRSKTLLVSKLADLQAQVLHVNDCINDEILRSVSDVDLSKTLNVNTDTSDVLNESIEIEKNHDLIIQECMCSINDLMGTMLKYKMRYNK